MGRSRRKNKRRIQLRPPRQLPTIFECPNCGARALTVDIDKKKKNELGEVLAIIRCGKCGLYAEEYVPQIYHPVDVYSKFLDKFLEGKAEYTIRKEAEVELSSLIAGEEASDNRESGEELTR